MEAADIPPSPKTQVERVRNAYILAGALLAFAVVLPLLTVFRWGWNSPEVAANGIVATTLFVFVLSLLVFFNIDPQHPKEFLQGSAVRTAIAIAFTVAYVQLLAFSLIAAQLQLNFDNPLMSNFFEVYIAIIGFYFGTAAAERVGLAKKGQGNPRTGDAAPPPS